MLYLLPFIAAAIGWFTNWVAVKMLFHPKEPRKVGPFTVQGIFPKRQLTIAQKIGKLVADELLTVEDLKEKVNNPESMALIIEAVEARMDHFLEFKMGEKFPLVALLTSRKMKMSIRGEMLKEVHKQMPIMLDDYITKFTEVVRVEDMIAEKFAGLSTEKLEGVMNDILEKEFRFIELIGAVLGFVVGIVQVLLVVLSR